VSSTPEDRMNGGAKILIAAGHDNLRGAIRDFLEMAYPDSHLIEARDGDVALRMALEHSPDIYLMDAGLAGTDGFQTTRSIKADFPKARVVLFTLCEGAEYMMAAKRAGADAFLRIEKMGDQLIPTISDMISRTDNKVAG